MAAGLAALPPAAALAGPAATTSGSGTYFGFRGIIEGFYGQPYTHADRMDLLSFEAAHGMNVFVDAPKEDPYVRSLWRHQYPSAELTQLLAEVRVATRLGVSWVPDIGPGLAEIPSPNVAVPDRDICFSCPADLQVLVDRFQPFVDAGARMVMVSFDDTLKSSSHIEDAAAYGAGDAAYGQMNADLLDRLAKALPGVTILTVPSDYSGTASTAYLKAFAAHLDPAIVVMWTGTSVVAPAIKGSDAAAFDSVVGRKVVVWDNYPANDYAGGIFGDPTNLFLGPVVGRGPDLVGQIEGIVANPMVEWQASKIPLTTLAADLADPYTYDPEAAWQSAITGFAGTQAPQVAELADNTRSSTLGQAESIRFEPDVQAFLAAYRAARWPAAAGVLSGELVAEANAYGELRASGFEPEFLAETAPFMDRLTRNARTGASALALLEGERPAVATNLQRDGNNWVLTGEATPPSPQAAAAQAQSLDLLVAQSAGDHHNVHGDRFTIDVDGDVYAARNLMDTFVETAQQFSAAWFPTAPLAASGVTVTVDGNPVPPDFELPVAAGTTVDVKAVDPAGGATEIQVQVPK